MKSISKYLPLFLFASLAGKIIYNGNPTSGEAVVLIGLGIISFAHQYYSNAKEIQVLTDKINSYTEENEVRFGELDLQIQDTVSALSSVKVGVGMRARRTVNE
jgi:hypothetical protein